MDKIKFLPTVIIMSGLLGWSHSALAEGDNDIISMSGFSVPTEQLDKHRARQGHDILQQLNDNNQQANLTQNQLQSAATGANTIYDGALQGIEGIATVIQNTGNQVIIQDSTLLNITVAP